MNRIFLTLALMAGLMAFGAISNAQKEAKPASDGADKTTSDSDEKSEETAEADPYALYKRLGRSWKHKSAIAMEGMDDIISYVEYEIIELTEEYSVQKMTALDKDGEAYAGMKPTETKIKFISFPDPSDDPDYEAPELTKETITVEAGEFECWFTEMSGTKSWTSIEFPGLLVKMRGKIGEMELVEWNKDGTKKDDDKSTEGTDKKPSEEGNEVDVFALYKKLGRKWTHRSTTTIAGMDPMVTYMKYEITEVTETYATQTMTILDKDKKKMAGMKPFDSKIEFIIPEQAADKGDAAPKLETETIKVEAGEFKCYKNDMAGTVSWVSVKYPGLLIKMKSGTTSMELIEWNEGGEDK